MNIRKTIQSDLGALAQIADETLFPGDMLADMAAPALSGEGTIMWLTALMGAVPRGFCFAAQEDMTNGTWNMRALAVAPDSHRMGVGRGLVCAIEARLSEAGARVLVVDTASDAEQAAARALYQGLGYAHAGTIPSFWNTGSDKVTFWKALNS